MKNKTLIQKGLLSSREFEIIGNELKVKTFDIQQTYEYKVKLESLRKDITYHAEKKLL